MHPAYLAGELGGQQGGHPLLEAVRHLLVRGAQLRHVCAPHAGTWQGHGLLGAQHVQREAREHRALHVGLGSHMRLHRTKGFEQQGCVCGMHVSAGEYRLLHVGCGLHAPLHARHGSERRVSCLSQVLDVGKSRKSSMKHQKGRALPWGLAGTSACMGLTNAESIAWLCDQSLLACHCLIACMQHDPDTHPVLIEGLVPGVSQ